MRFLKVIVCVLAVAFSGSVLAEEVRYRKLLSLNGDNIGQVTQGMSEAQVREVMGSYTSEVRDGAIDNPWRMERVGSDTVILHYLTRRNPPFTPLMENQATPVIITNGAVAAIGRDFLRDARNVGSVQSQPSASGSGGASLSERLNTLDELLESGAIDQPTYDAQKERILNSI